MACRYEPVVVLLPVDDFAALEASALEHDHDTYLHAHWLLARALGVPMPVSPARSEERDGPAVAQKSAARG